MRQNIFQEEINLLILFQLNKPFLLPELPKELPMRVKATSENKRFEYQSEIFIKYLDVKWRVVNGEIEKAYYCFFHEA